MKSIIHTHVQTIFDLTTDLANSAPEGFYSQKLGRLPSNTFGEQLWCMVGSRESYLRQMQGDTSAAWSCSVKEAANKLQLMQALFETSNEIIAWIENNEIDNSSMEILLKLIEHESQHHGQLIRYIYGNKWPFPESWRKHYTV